MKKFEYKVIGYTPGIKELNEFGKEGWELCAIEVHEEKTNSYQIKTQELTFKREVSNIDYAGLLISCAYERNVAQLQHRTILEFAQFVEDVMSGKNPEYEKYQFDFNETDAIRTWIEKFREYCVEYYRQMKNELHESEMKELHEREIKSEIERLKNLNIIK